jgi:hypothetical protein
MYPCGVESPAIVVFAVSSFVAFLMYRVELKASTTEPAEMFASVFLMYRVELKAWLLLCVL